MKCSFFQAAVVSILLYGCTIWTLTKRMEKKFEGNYIRILWAILNKSWKQHPKKQHLYGHLPPITKNIKIRRTKHAGYCWRNRDELISDLLLWTPFLWTSKGRTTSSNLHTADLCRYGMCPEDRPKAIDDREGWRERVRDIRADNVTWYIYIYIYKAH